MKKRTPEEIRKDLDNAISRLKEVQEKGDLAISKYDLSLGYDADFYLNRCPLLANHVTYFKRELSEATKHGEQASLF